MTFKMTKQEKVLPVGDTRANSLVCAPTYPRQRDRVRRKLTVQVKYPLC